VRTVAISLSLLASFALAAQVPEPSGKGAEAEARAAAAAEARTRTIARMLVQVEGRHRAQVADLERIVRLCEESRHDVELRLAIHARHAEDEDYRARMRAFEVDLGAVLYARFRAAMDVGPGSEPALRAIPAEPPPPPEPLPHEIEEQDAAKRAREEEGGG